MEFESLSKRVIGCALEVHRHLGPGLLESAYEERLAYEIEASGLRFARQVDLPVVYKGLRLDCGFRMDFVVDNALVLEIKSVESLTPIHQAQLLTHLRLSRMRIGLLINFNERFLKDGLKRLVL